jgi:hypothetical protein
MLLTTLCIILCTFAYGEEGQFASMQNLSFYLYLYYYDPSEVLLVEMEASPGFMAHIN